VSTPGCKRQDGDHAIDAVRLSREQGVDAEVDPDHFNPTGIKRLGAIEKVKTSGGQQIRLGDRRRPATVFKGMIQAGLDIPVAQPAAINPSPRWINGELLPKQLILASAAVSEHDGVLTLDPRMEKAQHDMYAVLKERNLKADNMVRLRGMPGSHRRSAAETRPKRLPRSSRITSRTSAISRRRRHLRFKQYRSAASAAILDRSPPTTCRESLGMALQAGGEPLNNRHRHCERSEAIQFNVERWIARRFAPRNDGSVRLRLLDSGPEPLRRRRNIERGNAERRGARR